jgi:hypothetical protein
MYPVAEWIAFNWWLLTHNTRAAIPTYPTHFAPATAWRRLVTGYAWPDLVVLPQGELAELRWRRTQPAATDIVYATQGRSALLLAEVHKSLTDVVETVLSRLDESGIRNTRSTKVWARLASLDHDEAQFCEASARLGLDPFSEGIEDASALEAVYEHLDAALLNDFLDAAEPAQLDDELAWVQSSLARARRPKAANGAAV